MKNEVGKDIDVSVDGMWQKTLGHNSLNGIVSAIAVTTVKVIDYEVQSKYRKQCEHCKNMDKLSPEYIEWFETHQSECSITHTGSSGSMEPKKCCKNFWSLSGKT